MRKAVLFVTLLFISFTGVLAQNKDQRTLQTKMADLLAEMPAENAARFNTAMQDLAGMGEAGIVGLAGMLKEPGKGDNTKVEYALSGFSGYVTKTGFEKQRKVSEKAYITALEKVSDPVNKAFIMAQIQTVGQGADVTNALKKYLHDERLTDPAARAIIQADPSGAGRELMTAASSAEGASRVSLLKALGEIRFKEALPLLHSLNNVGDTRLQYVVYDAIANIGDVSSLSVLSEAAKRNSYVYDATNATNAYLMYLNRLIENGNQDVAQKELQNLLKKAGNADQVQARISAMTLLYKLQKGNQKLLRNAVTDKSPQYRAAALKLVPEKMSEGEAMDWIKMLKKSKPEVQAEIITMLGDKGTGAVVSDMLPYLNTKDKEVLLATITTLGKLGGQEVLPAIMMKMHGGTADVIAAAGQAIRIMPGESVSTLVSNFAAKSSGNAQAALVNILGERRASGSADLIFSLLNSPDQNVRNASFKALPQVVDKQDLSKLTTLVKSTAEMNQKSKIQEAMIAALGGMDKAADRSAYVLKEMQEAGAAQKPSFYRVLASIGDQPSLNAVESGFKNGDASARSMALDALAQWNGMNAAEVLYRIGKETDNAEFRNKAVSGYVNAVRKSSLPAEQKLLMLRNAMDIAKSNDQKLQILRAAGENKTFNTIVFAGKYLDDAALQQAAARVVMNIALSDKKYAGDVVRDLLNKTILVLKGNDSDYEKQAIRKYLAEMPEGPGWVSIFNGKDLTGWKGLVANPIKRAAMDSKTLAAEQAKADEIMRKGWYAKDGELVFTGKGDNICTTKDYGDFEMLVDWKIDHDGDAGIYLRGSPQVQIWDTSRRDVGAEVGSGGLYNNQVHQDKPLKLADNAIGDWNHFYIKMVGDRVTVYLNGELVTDNTILENYWDRKMPIFPVEQIELQAHGTEVVYRDIYIREIPRPKPFVLSEDEKKEGYKILFDGTNMHSWTGATDSYVLEDGNIVIYPDRGRGGNLYTKDEYGDFSFRFEFMLTPGANNGVGIRTPMEGDAAYEGMEIQILDDDADIYKDLHDYQYHGSVYGVIPAKRGHLKPMGQWNTEEIIAKGNKIKVILNGTVIVDGDVAAASKNGTLDGNDHPGLKRTKGHIGFLGHGSLVKFRNIRVKDLSK